MLSKLASDKPSGESYASQHQYVAGQTFDLTNPRRVTDGLFNQYWLVCKLDAAAQKCAEVLKKDWQCPKEPVCVTEAQFPNPLPAHYTKEQYIELCKRNWEKEMLEWPKELRLVRSLISKAIAILLARLSKNCVDHCKPVIQKDDEPEVQFAALKDLIVKSWKSVGYFGVAALMVQLTACNDGMGIINMLDKVDILCDEIAEMQVDMRPTSGFLLALMCCNVSHPEFARILMTNCKSFDTGYTFRKWADEVRQLVQTNPMWADPRPLPIAASEPAATPSRMGPPASANAVAVAPTVPYNPECFNCGQFGHTSPDCTRKCKSCPDSGHKGSSNWHESGPCPIRKQIAAAKQAEKAKAKAERDAKNAGATNNPPKPQKKRKVSTNSDSSTSQQAKAQRQEVTQLLQAVGDLAKSVETNRLATEARFRAADA